MSGPVLIAGGGIGGLTAAIALQRAGRSVQVFERAPELRPVGAGIVLAVNALQVLKALGVHDEVAAVGMPVQEVELFTPGGRRISTLRFGEVAKELGVGALAFHRAELHEALVRCLAPGVLRLGAPVVGFEEHGERVRLVLEGDEVVEGEALIGADGLHSVVRRVLGDLGEPDYAGQTSWRGVTGPLPEDVPLTAFETWGRGLRFGTVALTGRRAYWFAVEKTAAGGRDDPERIREEVRARFQGWHAPIDALIAATPSGAVVRTDLFDKKPTREWGRGRVTLLGDAAHPMTPNLGQGASQSMEDAAVLARELCGTDEVTSALRRYEAVRQRRTAPIVTQARRFGAIAHWENPIACWIRNRLIAAVPERVQLAQARRMLLPR